MQFQSFEKGERGSFDHINSEVLKKDKGGHLITLIPNCISPPSLPGGGGVIGGFTIIFVDESCSLFVMSSMYVIKNHNNIS